MSTLVVAIKTGRLPRLSYLEAVWCVPPAWNVSLSPVTDR